MDDEVAPPPSPHSPEPVTTNTSISLHHNTRLPATSFFDLPPEIRNEVYNWLFPTGRSAAQLLARRNGGYIPMSDRFDILATCRQVYEEASSLLRGQHRFAIVRPKTLFDVMEANFEDVEAKIIEYVTPDCVINVNYDLDHHIMSSDPVSVLQVSRELRERNAYHLTIQITATIAAAGDLRKLRQWTQSGRWQISPVAGLALGQFARIVLLFSRPSRDSIAGSHFDVAELLWATRELPWHANVEAVVADEEETTLRANKDLLHICAILLLFIHTLISQSSNGSICPKIWMNEELEVVYADVQREDGSIERVPNKYAYRSRDEIYGFLYAGAIVHHYGNTEVPQTRDNFGSTGISGADEEMDGARERETLLSVAKTLSGHLTGRMY